MEKLTMSEQDIINAICLHIADYHRIEPSDVEVELAHDDDEGFSAEAYFEGRKQNLPSFQLIQAIRFWIEHELQEDPIGAGIQLELDPDEGIIAYIN